VQGAELDVEIKTFAVASSPAGLAGHMAGRADSAKAIAASSIRTTTTKAYGTSSELQTSLS
jgi:hypothetical protein